MSFFKKLLTASALTALILPTQVHAAQTYNIFVAPKGSDAYENAKEKENDTNIWAEKKIHKAFNRASALLGKCGDCTVNVKISGGEYKGKAGSGNWAFPDTQAPEATLRILGGYNDDFSERDPFNYVTSLITTAARSTAIVYFKGNNHSFNEVIFSGFLLDAAHGNKYSKRNNSMNKGGSSTWRLVQFGYMTTNKFTVSDNIFMNAAHGVSAPLIRSKTEHSEIVIKNNFFLNNVFTWQIKSPSNKLIPEKYTVQGNSYILGWPYNPDRTTSNPGTLEIGNKRTAKTIEIKDNLFAYNVGGAVFPQWDEANGPKLEIKGNLFHDNGQMFSPKNSSDGAIVGKFSGSGRHMIYDIEVLEDEFDWDSEDNISLDPEIQVAVAKVKTVSYGTQAPVDSSPDEAIEETIEDDDLSDLTSLDDLDEDNSGDDLADLASLDDLKNEDDASSPTEAEDSTIDDMDVELDIGLESFDMDEYAVDGNIKNYAPRLHFSKEMLIPQNEAAREYGASSERVEQYD